MPSVALWMGVEGKKMNAISLLLVSQSLPFLFLDMTHFYFPYALTFPPHFPHFCELSFCPPHPPPPPPLLYRGHCASCECY